MKILLSLLLTFTAAQAIPITFYDTGFVDPPDGDGLPVTTQRIVEWNGFSSVWGADSFTIGDTWELTNINLWTYDTFDAGVDRLRDVNYEIRRGSDFLTSDLLSSGSAGFGLQTVVLPDHQGGPGTHGGDRSATVFSTFGVSRVILEPDTYWLAINGHSDPGSVNGGASWSRAATGDGIAWSDTGTGWTQQNGDGAFALVGELVSGSGNHVPDAGSTMMLLGMALVGLRLMHRR